MPKPLASGAEVSSAFLNDLVGVYDRSTSTVDVVSTTTETTIYTKTIAAGAMSTDRMLRLELEGDYLNNTGSGRQPVLKVKFGGTSLVSETLASIAASANRYPWKLVVALQNLGLTNSQLLHATFVMGTANGGFKTAEIIDGTILAASTIDTTAAQDLVVTIQLETSGTTDEWRKRAGMLELL